MAVWVALIGVTNHLPIIIAEVNSPPALQATLKAFLAPINIEFVAGMIAAVAVRSLALVWARCAGGRYNRTRRVLRNRGNFASMVWSSVAIVIAGLVRIEISGPLAAPRYLHFLDNASYAIYLIYDPIISITVGILRKQLFGGVLRLGPQIDFMATKQERAPSTDY